MIIIYLIIISLVILGIYVLFIHHYQKKKDQRFVDHLRSQEGTLILSVPFTHERFEYGANELIDSRSSDSHNILIGNGYLVMTEPIFALFNRNILQGGLEGITWSIDFDQAKIIDEDSLVIECILPDDDSTYSRFTFKNILKDVNREKVANKLGIR